MNKIMLSVTSFLFVPLLIVSLLNVSSSNLEGNQKYELISTIGSNDADDSLPDGYLYLEENRNNRFEKIYLNEVTVKNSGYTQITTEHETLYLPNNNLDGGEIIQAGDSIGTMLFSRKARVLKVSNEYVLVDYVDSTKVSISIPFEGYSLDKENIDQSLYYSGLKLVSEVNEISFNSASLCYVVEVNVSNDGSLFAGNLVNYNIGTKVKMFDGLIVEQSFIYGSDEKYVYVLSAYKQRDVIKKHTINVIDAKFNFCLISGDSINANMKIVAPVFI